MDHPYIDEHNIVARYGMGRLSAEECVRFEEHFVDCSRCLEQLETTEDFRQALKTVAAEGATHSRFGGAPGPSLSRAVSRWRPVLIAVAACLAVLAVPGFLLIQQARLAHTEVNQANATAENWHHQYVAEQQTSAELEKKLHEATQKAQPNAAVAAALPVATTVFTLETVRGAESAGAEPVNQIVISRSTPSVTLSVDREDLEEAPSYEATLTDSHGRILGQLTNLGPSAGINVPVTLLHAGDYVLTVQGSHNRARGIARRYPFRVKFTP